MKKSNVKLIKERLYKIKGIRKSEFKKAILNAILLDSDCYIDVQGVKETWKQFIVSCRVHHQHLTIFINVCSEGVIDNQELISVDRIQKIIKK